MPTKRGPKPRNETSFGKWMSHHGFTNSSLSLATGACPRTVAYWRGGGPLSNAYGRLLKALYPDCPA